jgi:hypothetical protein
LPQVRGEVPVAEPAGAAKKAEDMTTQELADKGEMIIFGEMGTLHGQGKGQCPLCHGFKKGDVSERAPNLAGIPQRAAERIRMPGTRAGLDSNRSVLRQRPRDNRVEYRRVALLSELLHRGFWREGEQRPRKPDADDP